MLRQWYAHPVRTERTAVPLGVAFKVFEDGRDAPDDIVIVDDRQNVLTSLHRVDELGRARHVPAMAGDRRAHVGLGVLPGGRSRGRALAFGRHAEHAVARGGHRVAAAR